MRRSFGLMAFYAGMVVSVAQGQGHEIPPLQPPHGELAPTFWEQHGWQIIGGVAICLLLLALIIFLLRRPKIVVPEPPATVARRALESWRNRAEDGTLAADVSRALRRYIVGALNFPSEELTTAEFRKALQSNGKIPRAIAGATADFLRCCDEWKFAPAPPAPRLEAVAVALALINHMEASRAPVPVTT